MDYLREGETETLRDGTLVERDDTGITVHNVPTDKGIFKNAVLESWINGIIADRNYKVKDVDGEEALAKDSIMTRILGTCAEQWGISPEKIAEALTAIYTPPQFSSISSEPSLNHHSEECRECAKHYSKSGKLEEFSIEDLLYAIESLHCCGKYLSQD